MDEQTNLPLYSTEGYRVFLLPSFTDSMEGQTRTKVARRRRLCPIASAPVSFGVIFHFTWTADGFHLLVPHGAGRNRVFTGFDWVRIGFTGFYWVLLGFTGFSLAFMGSTCLYLMAQAVTGFLPGLTRFESVLLGFTGFPLAFMGLSGLEWVSLDFYQVVVGSSEFYCVFLGSTGFYWVLIGFTGFYWV